MALMPKESAKLVAGLAKDVFVEQAGVKKLALAVLNGLKTGKIRPGNFSQIKYHPRPDDPRAADWIFVLDTLNFSFWTETGTKKWRVNKETGYFAFCAAVKRAIDAGKPMWDPKYYSQITLQDAETIFRGDDEVGIPLIHERVKGLQEAGKVLLDKYHGTFVECIKSCGGSAEKLLQLIVREFESYRDEADYEGHRISIYKRAQILIGDIWACYEGRGLGEFHDIDSIAMFADYRIPQVLVYYGAMRYSDSLMSKLRSDEPLKQGSREEVEIRACSIEAVEQVCDEVRRLIKADSKLGLNPSKDVNAIIIDHYLWDYRREYAEELESIPFHKTRTIYY
ncbi:queuosine salvage protein [Pogonomyrmex barbatus]|uniref:Queuosine 5'-phosphate N-glycosylase/hydrolase n=1 Tax=Pogonomyrmex barbatus TaxID=144034 RepID=A0A6I9X0U7_9HYME|nr:queuosine salvage protein [Pogonomyrmex barbatus]